MLYTVVSLEDIFYNGDERKQARRSSNPFDYIRNGYFIDNASLFGGQNNVSFNSNFSGNISGDMLHNSHK